MPYAALLLMFRAPEVFINGPPVIDESRTMGTDNRLEALQVVETVKQAGRIFEDAQNHVWFVPTDHPIFSAVTMVAGPVSRQIEAGHLATGIDGTRRYAEVSPDGDRFLIEHSGADAIAKVDRWLANLFPDETELPV